DKVMEEFLDPLDPEALPRPPHPLGDMRIFPFSKLVLIPVDEDVPQPLCQVRGRDQMSAILAAELRDLAEVDLDLRRPLEEL
ncbi:MAG: hypothetical protein ACE5LQ_08080, partial [Candidatus Bipolaricaulia bacterium]